MLTKLVAGVVFAVLVAVAVVGWQFAIFVLPFSWSGEPDRLAQALRLSTGQTVADIGAGDGALAVEMARRVGDSGVVYATELSEDRRRDIESRLASTHTGQVRVVQATEDETRLPDGCCDAVYLRTVFHHVEDKPAFARALARAVRLGGRVAVIDFAPGDLWFHGGDHGVSQEEVVTACNNAGLALVQRTPDWGGGTYLLVFERAR